MTAYENLLASYDAKDYSKMTSLELFKLVHQNYLYPETADRLLKEASIVS